MDFSILATVPVMDMLYGYVRYLGWVGVGRDVLSRGIALNRKVDYRCSHNPSDILLAGKRPLDISCQFMSCAADRAYVDQDSIGRSITHAIQQENSENLDACQWRYHRCKSEKTQGAYV